ncbi:hypothetical protein J4Q44_G00192320 [Coregonus suidteri]|uniref:Uncharacterized protein n=1 Tax=Coregonus suidteri TaxID=861788 RepID=A0AAN8LF76_9TELE
MTDFLDKRPAPLVANTASIGMMMLVLRRMVLTRPGVPQRNHRWMKILMKRSLTSLKILGTAVQTKNTAHSTTEEQVKIAMSFHPLRSTSVREAQHASLNGSAPKVTASGNGSLRTQ